MSAASGVAETRTQLLIVPQFKNLEEERVIAGTPPANYMVVWNARIQAQNKAGRALSGCELPCAQTERRRRKNVAKSYEMRARLFFFCFFLWELAVHYFLRIFRQIQNSEPSAVIFVLYAPSARNAHLHPPAAIRFGPIPNAE